MPRANTCFRMNSSTGFCNRPIWSKSFQIDKKDSWLYAAMEKKLPMFVPGWEDSTLGNMYAGHCISGDVKNVHTVRTGIEYMMSLAEWYTKTSKTSSIGFFQIGGGIAGDFPICVVPMLRQDLEREHTPCGVTSVRSAIQLRVTAPIPGRFRTRRSRGGSFVRIRQNSL